MQRAMEEDAAVFRTSESLQSGVRRLDRIDDKDHRGRDEDAECSAGRERSGGEGARVAVLLEFGQRDSTR